MSCCCGCCRCDDADNDLGLEFEQSNVDCFSEPSEPMTPELRTLVREAYRGLDERIRLVEKFDAMLEAMS